MAEVLNRASTDTPTPHFPDDVLIEIFLRLPVRSLLLFKSVSKRWLTLIKNPDFIRLHLNRPINNSIKDPILIVRAIETEDDDDDDDDDADDDGDEFFLTMLSDDETLSYIDDFPLRFFSPRMTYTDMDLKRLHLLGPCNGLFCITNSVEVVVFNPATRRCRKVCRSPQGFSRGGYQRDSVSYEMGDDFGYDSKVGCYDSVGFGYDSVSNDYKVVWFKKVECSHGCVNDGSDDDDDDDDSDDDDDDSDDDDDDSDDDDDDMDVIDDDDDMDVIDDDDDMDDIDDDDDMDDESDDYNANNDNEHDIGNDYEGCFHGLPFVIEIFSSSTNSWRKIRRVVQATDNISSTHSYSLFFNAAFHWLHACAILVFDLNKEDFKWFKLPVSFTKWLKSFNSFRLGDEVDDFHTHISVLNESLALIVHRKCNLHKKRAGFDIWVMMEYGVRRSWRKLYNISLDMGIKKPLSFSKEGELLAVKKIKGVKPYGSKKWEFMSFDLKTMAAKTFEIYGVPKSVHAFRYRESLVSLR